MYIIAYFVAFLELTPQTVRETAEIVCAYVAFVD